ncbi:MAG: hypothetical protein WBC73_15930, partial [Phormidesmis sp.]
EKYSLRQGGVLAGLTKHNPQLQEMQDSFMAKQAISEGYSAQEVEKAIAEHSPRAQSSPDAGAYARRLVEKEAGAIRKSHRQGKRQAQSKGRSRVQKRARSRNNDVGL